MERGARIYTYLQGQQLVIDQSASLTVLDPLRQREITLTGELAEEARRTLFEDGVGTRLRALAPLHPGARAVVDLIGQEHTGPGPAEGIRLSGFATLFIELLGRCNERCVHCYASAGPEIRSALPLDVCEQIVDDAASLGFSRIQFTGGDPLLCRFLPELVERVRTLGVAQSEIYTNGLALYDELLGRLTPAAPSFAFSLYSHREAVHDAVTQTRGSQRRTSDAIRRTAAAGLPVRVGVIAMSENAGDAQETVDFARSLGAAQVAVSGSYAVGRGDRSAAEVSVASGNAHGYESANRQPQGKLCVTYEGKVVPCVFNRDTVLGDIYQRRLSEVAADPEVPEALALDRSAFVDRCSAQLQCSSCKVVACSLQLHGESAQ